MSHQLTKEYKQTLIYLAQGLTAKEIAGRMNSKRRTIEDRIYNLCRKYKCLNSVNLIAHCIANGVIHKEEFTVLEHKT